MGNIEDLVEEMGYLDDNPVPATGDVVETGLNVPEVTSDTAAVAPLLTSNTIVVEPSGQPFAAPAGQTLEDPGVGKLPVIPEDVAETHTGEHLPTTPRELLGRTMSSDFFRLLDFGDENRGRAASQELQGTEPALSPESSLVPTISAPAAVDNAWVPPSTRAAEVAEPSPLPLGTVVPPSTNPANATEPSQTGPSAALASAMRNSNPTRGPLTRSKSNDLSALLEQTRKTLSTSTAKRNASGAAPTPAPPLPASQPDRGKDMSPASLSETLASLQERMRKTPRSSAGRVGASGQNMGPPPAVGAALPLSKSGKALQAFVAAAAAKLQNPTADAAQGADRAPSTANPSQPQKELEGMLKRLRDAMPSVVPNRDVTRLPSASSVDLAADSEPAQVPPVPLQLPTQERRLTRSLSRDVEKDLTEKVKAPQSRKRARGESASEPKPAAPAAQALQKLPARGGQSMSQLLASACAGPTAATPAAPAAPTAPAASTVPYRTASQSLAHLEALMELDLDPADPPRPTPEPAATVAPIASTDPPVFTTAPAEAILTTESTPQTEPPSTDTSLPKQPVAPSEPVVVSTSEEDLKRRHRQDRMAKRAKTRGAAHGDAVPFVVVGTAAAGSHEREAEDASATPQWGLAGKKATGKTGPEVKELEAKLNSQELTISFLKKEHSKLVKSLEEKGIECDQLRAELTRLYAENQRLARLGV
ncbi:hypothetical protein CYMTET_23237 [Cymbomonas tetramitiformis]|uniref:Uncharacterized protein n=1 Tax=Cymbomonas tetramitiformis TaxID=36881 RepID=A0AAE0L157_9CHLO|nr:hypothetical protein CYMTET_23237 [Cymbomonas tetramitiformis]